jgi:hypothetical protein
MRATGLAFDRARPILLNVIAGAIATLCLARWRAGSCPIARRIGVVTLFAFFPTSFVLQVPYAEADCTIAFRCRLPCRAGRRARFRLAAVLLLGAAPDRVVSCCPSPQPRGGALWSGWRDRQNTNRGADLGVLAGVATISPMLWVAVAGLVTGQPGLPTRRHNARGATRSIGVDAHALVSGDWRSRPRRVPHRHCPHADRGCGY